MFKTHVKVRISVQKIAMGNTNTLLKIRFEGFVHILICLCVRIETNCRLHNKALSVCLHVHDLSALTTDHQPVMYLATNHCKHESMF